MERIESEQMFFPVPLFHASETQLLEHQQEEHLLAGPMRNEKRD